jgi:hypothetical protein
MISHNQDGVGDGDQGSFAATPSGETMVLSRKIGAFALDRGMSGLD